MDWEGYCLGFTIEGQGFGFRVSDLGLRVEGQMEGQGLGFGVSGLGLRVEGQMEGQGLGFRV